MRSGRRLIDMHVHLARYEVLSDSTRERRFVYTSSFLIAPAAEF